MKQKHKYCPVCLLPYILIASTLNSDLNDIEEIAECIKHRIYNDQKDIGCGWSGNPKELLTENQKLKIERKLKLEKINEKYGKKV